MGPNVVWGVKAACNDHPLSGDLLTRCAMKELPPPLPTTPSDPHATVEKAWKRPSLASKRGAEKPQADAEESEIALCTGHSRESAKDAGATFSAPQVSPDQPEKHAQTEP